MANTELVCFDDTGSDRPSNGTTSNTKNTRITFQQKKATSSASKVTTTGSSVIWEALGTTEFANEMKKIIFDSWRIKTKTWYEGVLKKWRNHCLQRNENSYITDIKSVLFLHCMNKNGCLYSGICVARSSLSSFVMIEDYDKLSSHPLITKFVKGIFNRHPPLPKYATI